MEMSFLFGFVVWFFFLKYVFYLVKGQATCCKGFHTLEAYLEADA